MVPVFEELENDNLSLPFSRGEGLVDYILWFDCVLSHCSIKVPSTRSSIWNHEASDNLGGYYRILCVSERFLSLILLGGEILQAATEITCSHSWDGLQVALAERAVTR